MIILEGAQRTDEWYAARLGVITASSCEGIMSPAMRKTYVNKMLAEIITKQPEPFPMNEHMEWGCLKEDEARIAYEDLKGVTVKEVSFVFKDESRKVGCSPDGLVGDDGLVEIKCPMTKTHLGYIQDGEPRKYFLQMQFQMYVLDKKWCDFVTYDPRLPEPVQLYCKRVYRCQETQDKIHSSITVTVKQIDDFLAKHNLTWKD